MCLRRDFDHCSDPRHVVRVDIHDSRFRIDCRAAPFPAAVETRQDDGALSARGDELTVTSHSPESVEYVAVRFGRDVGHLVLSEPLACEWRRFGWYWLGGPGDFPRDVGRWEWLLFDRKNRFAGLAVEHEDMCGLCDLCDYVALHPILLDSQQVWRCRKIAVPDIVMDGLEMPETFAC